MDIRNGMCLWNETKIYWFCYLVNWIYHLTNSFVWNEWRPMKNMFIGVGICQWKLWKEHLSIHSLMKKNIKWENNPLKKICSTKIYAYISNHLLNQIFIIEARKRQTKHNLKLLSRYFTEALNVVLFSSDTCLFRFRHCRLAFCSHSPGGIVCYGSGKICASAPF